MKLRTVLLGVSFAMLQGVAFAQSPKAETKKPSQESLAAAYKAATDIFTKLSAGKTEEVAAWIAEEIGYTRDPASRMTLKGDFKNKLDLIMTSPPVTPYGKISGYDLINESYLPNSSRYFRLIYITYHEDAPLIWEFRYYVKPDGKIALSYIQWSEANPFEFVTRPEVNSIPNAQTK